MQIENPERLDRDTLIAVAESCEAAASGELRATAQRDVDLMINAVLLTLARTLRAAAGSARVSFDSPQWQSLLYLTKVWTRIKPCTKHRYLDEECAQCQKVLFIEEQLENAVETVQEANNRRWVVAEPSDAEVKAWAIHAAAGPPDSADD